MLILGMACGLLGTVKPAAAQAPADNDGDELEQKLLDDLSNDLLEGLDLTPAPADGDALKSGSPSETPNQAPGATEDNAKDPLGQGEDIEFGPEADPLLRIGQKMQAVSQRLRKRDTSQTTREAQKQISQELAKLIDQAQQQNQQSSSSNSSAASSSSSSSESASSQPAAAAGQANQAAPQESTDRLGEDEAGQRSQEELEALIKEVWGHLPERVRDQVQNSAVERFLPKYERLIEDYFRRLAEKP